MGGTRCADNQEAAKEPTNDLYGRRQHLPVRLFRLSSQDPACIPWHGSRRHHRRIDPDILYPEPAFQERGHSPDSCLWLLPLYVVRPLFPYLPAPVLYRPMDLPLAAGGILLSVPPKSPLPVFADGAAAELHPFTLYQNGKYPRGIYDPGGFTGLIHIQRDNLPLQK